MKDFWKDTGKIIGTLVEWAWYLGLVVCVGFMVVLMGSCQSGDIG